MGLNGLLLKPKRDKSSFLLFHKIHCGPVSIEKDKYMTPVHSSKTTRSLHSAQYCRHQTYGDVLKNLPTNFSTLEWSLSFCGPYPVHRGVKGTLPLVKTQLKVRKRAKIRNQYSKASHLTQDTNGEVTTSQLDITNENQEVSLFPAGDQKALINRRTRRHNKNKTEIT